MLPPVDRQQINFWLVFFAKSKLGDVNEVCNYAKLFAEQCVDPSSIKTLKSNKLSDLGIKSESDNRAIMSYIQQLQENPWLDNIISWYPSSFYNTSSLDSPTIKYSYDEPDSDEESDDDNINVYINYDAVEETRQLGLAKAITRSSMFEFSQIDVYRKAIKNAASGFDLVNELAQLKQSETDVQLQTTKTRFRRQHFNNTDSYHAEIIPLYEKHQTRLPQWILNPGKAKKICETNECLSTSDHTYALPPIYAPYTPESKPNQKSMKKGFKTLSLQQEGLKIKSLSFNLVSTNECRETSNHTYVLPPICTSVGNPDDCNPTKPKKKESKPSQKSKKKGFKALSLHEGSQIKSFSYGLVRQRY